MINFINKSPKWEKMTKSGSAYLHSFGRAVSNFEENIREERQSRGEPKEGKHTRPHHPF
ncbi:MAG: hypothetical protein KF717_06245 [Cyclobacteriaceae bacterium]|nr:hypothetical protein [Cyclobacteriaceae bacterium]